MDGEVGKMKIDKEDLYNAIKEGTKEALHEMMESGNGYNGPIRTEQVMEAIRQGVFDAIWAVATNATDAPCSDFYSNIRQGIKEGISEMELKSGFNYETH